MSEPTNQPSHRPLRKGEIVQEGDESKGFQGWRKVEKFYFGLPYMEPPHDPPMRRPVKDL